MLAGAVGSLVLVGRAFSVPGCAGDVAGAAGEGCGCGVGWPSAGCDCKTEREPVIAGSESVRATSMKRAAAPMVIFAKSVCVPRGPKAVDDTLLEKSAPASALPGCKSTAMTSTIHVKIKMPYKT